MDNEAPTTTPKTAAQFQAMADNAIRVEGKRARAAALRELDRVWPYMPTEARAGVETARRDDR